LREVCEVVTGGDLFRSIMNALHISTREIIIQVEIRRGASLSEVYADDEKKAVGNDVTEELCAHTPYVLRDEQTQSSKSYLQ